MITSERRTGRSHESGVNRIRTRSKSFDGTSLSQSLPQVSGEGHIDLSIQSAGRRGMLTILARVLHHPVVPLLLLVLANAVFYI